MQTVTVIFPRQAADKKLGDYTEEMEIEAAWSENLLSKHLQEVGFGDPLKRRINCFSQGAHLCGSLHSQGGGFGTNAHVPGCQAVKWGRTCLVCRIGTEEPNEADFNLQMCAVAG